MTNMPGQQICDFQVYVQHARNNAGNRARRHRHHACYERVNAVDDKNGRDGCAQRERAVHRQIGKIKDLIGNIHAEYNRRVYQPLFKYSQYKFQCLFFRLPMFYSATSVVTITAVSIRSSGIVMPSAVATSVFIVMVQSVNASIGISSAAVPSSIAAIIAPVCRPRL